VREQEMRDRRAEKVAERQAEYIAPAEDGEAKKKKKKKSKSLEAQEAEE